jgi:hypothetical protein
MGAYTQPGTQASARTCACFSPEAPVFSSSSESATTASRFPAGTVRRRDAPPRGPVHSSGFPPLPDQKTNRCISHP